MNEVKFVIPGAAVGKGRARSVPLMRGGKPVIGAGGRPVVTHHTPAKTENFENLVKLAAGQAMLGRELMAGAVELKVAVFITPPESWSEKKKRAAIAGDVIPTVKPDCSNILKSIEDAMNGVVYLDDKQIADLTMRKRYADRAETLVTVKGGA